MTTKTFDCVAMKREAAERIYQQINGMTIEEELRFWNSSAENDNDRKENARQHSGEHHEYRSTVRTAAA